MALRKTTIFRQLSSILVNKYFANTENMKKYLQEVVKRKEVVADLFAIEHSTHRPKKLYLSDNK